LHKSGALYTWEDISVPMAECPQWIIDYTPTKRFSARCEVVRTPGEKLDTPEKVEAIRAILRDEPPAISGQRGHDRTWAVVQRILIKKHVSLDDARPLLLEWNQRCQPPWYEEDFERKIDEVLTKSDMVEGVLDAAGVIASMAKKARATQAAAKAAAKHSYDWSRAIVTVEGEEGPHPITYERVRRWLCSGDWENTFRRDEFYDTTRAVDPIFDLDCEGRDDVTENDVTRVRAYLEREMKWVATKGDIRDAIQSAARGNAPYHPVRDYLAGLPPTPEAAAHAFFEGIAGRIWANGPTDAEEGIAEGLARLEKESEIFKRWAVAAVRRILAPGTQVDDMIILVGEQGHRKSSFLRHLFAPYFSDQLPSDWSNRDASHALQGQWCIEISELAAWGKNGEEARKGYLSRSEDIYRQYGTKDRVRWKRQNVFAGTTNDQNFLRDPTGARRYNVIHVERPIDVEAVGRDAFWSAALTLARAGYIHYFEATDQELNAAREGHFEHDPWHEPVLEYIAMRENVTSTEVYAHLVTEVARRTQPEKRRVEAILRSICGPTKPLRRAGAKKMVKAYVVPKHIQAEAPKKRVPPSDPAALASADRAIAASEDVVPGYFRQSEAPKKAA
jgi:putative DNA primase/helicase